MHKFICSNKNECPCARLALVPVLKLVTMPMTENQRYDTPWYSKGTTELPHKVSGQTSPPLIYSKAAKSALLLPTSPFPMSLWRPCGGWESSWALGEVLSSWWDALSTRPVGWRFLHPQNQERKHRGRLVRAAGYTEGGRRTLLPWGSLPRCSSLHPIQC